jgi:lipoprotein
MKTKFFSIFAIAAACMFSLFGCNSDTIPDPTPRDVIGILKYTGATYAPFHAPKPYNYAIYDINDGFVAYVDTTKIVMPQLNSYRDKLVEIRGSILKEDGESVLRAEGIRLKR